MKNILIASICLALASCKTHKEDLATNPALPAPFNGPGVSRERVLAIADKYGLRDSIAEGYKPSTLKPPPAEAYPYLSEAFFEGYFANWRKYLDWLKEEALRQQKVAGIQTVFEYFAYIESDPDLYRSEIESAGGSVAYDTFKKDALAGKYHIYICSYPDKGTYPTIIYANDDYPGRISGRLLQIGN